MSGTREKHGRKGLDVENCKDITWKNRQRWENNSKKDFTEIELGECGLD
jgi:hypothetical protein